MAKTDLDQAFEQLFEIQRMLMAGAIPPEIVGGPLRRIIEKDFSVRDRIEMHEPSGGLGWQLQKIYNLNRTAWNGFLSEEQLRAANALLDGTKSRRLDELYVLHVEGDTPAHTIEMWCKALGAEHPKFRWSQTWQSVRSKETVGLAEGARVYSPGIHLVCLNLVAWWRPDVADSDYQSEVNPRILRERAVSGSAVPAHGEVLSALGLHEDLMRAISLSGLRRLAGQVLTGYKLNESGGVLSLVKADDNVEFALLQLDRLAPHNALPLVVTTPETGG